MPEELEEDEEIDIDPHIGCYSYPNCDIDPSGCREIMGNDVEEYGYRE